MRARQPSLQSNKTPAARAAAMAAQSPTKGGKRGEDREKELREKGFWKGVQQTCRLDAMETSRRVTRTVQGPILLSKKQACELGDSLGLKR